MIKSVPIPVESSTSILSAAVNAGVVATMSSSTLQANVSAACVVHAVVEETSLARSHTTSADSQCNTPSSVYDRINNRKPESTDATPNDDTQIRAARHMDVTFELESKEWIFGVLRSSYW